MLRCVWWIFSRWTSPRPYVTCLIILSPARPSWTAATRTSGPWTLWTPGPLPAVRRETGQWISPHHHHYHYHCDHYNHQVVMASEYILSRDVTPIFQVSDSFTIEQCFPIDFIQFPRFSHATITMSLWTILSLRSFCSSRKMLWWVEKNDYLDSLVSDR